MNPKKLCRKCVLPETFPGISFSKDGICNHCLENKHKSFEFSKIRLEIESMVNEEIREKAGSGTYDIVLAFSGGKDSTYTLKYLCDNFSARIIAITIDNGFIAKQAAENCRTVPGNLGVDHIMFKPAPNAMIETYNKSLDKDIFPTAALKRASAICNGCIQVINTQILNFAIKYGISIVAGGYIGGQVPVDSGYMKQNLSVTRFSRAKFIKKINSHLSKDAIRLFELESETNRALYVINPMLYLNESEDDIIREIKTIGWIKPNNTGKASTNCLLNDYAIHKHIEAHDFHPYIFEISEQIRRGLISREDAIRKVSTEFDKKQFSEIEKQLGR